MGGGEEEVKHAPGPWEIRSDAPYSVDGFVVFSGRGENNRTIARFPYGNVVGKPKGWEERDKNYQQLKANVNLISAAPELLDACKMALEDVTGPITSQGIKIRFETLDKLREALTKAEGR